MGGRRGRDILRDRITAALRARTARPAQLSRALAAWEDQQTRDTRWSGLLARSRPVGDLRRAYWGEILRRVERRVTGRQAALRAAQQVLATHGRHLHLRTWERVRAQQPAAPFDDPFWGKRGALHWLDRVLNADASNTRDWLDLRPEILALEAVRGRLQPTSDVRRAARLAALPQDATATERLLCAYDVEHFAPDARLVRRGRPPRRLDVSRN